jgi:hypothetical protein
MKMDKKKITFWMMVLLIGLILTGCAGYAGYYGDPYDYGYYYGYPYYGYGYFGYGDLHGFGGHHEFGEHHMFSEHHEGGERHEGGHHH